MKSNNQGLKMLAQIAKKRLKGEVVRKEQTRFTPLRENIKLLSSEEDEKLYRQVCNILTENKDIINPIGKLIDYKTYNNLNRLDKERYFFKLADKYGEFKTKFEKEKSMVV